MDFHPLETKSSRCAYIMFEVASKMSLIPNFQENRCSFKDFGGNFIFFPSLTGLILLFKELIVEFLLLQTIIHHPRGVVQNHRYASAAKWNAWQKCLKMTYSLIMEEIRFFFKLPYKNKSFFITNGEVMKLSHCFSELVVEIFRQVCRKFRKF